MIGIQIEKNGLVRAMYGSAKVRDIRKYGLIKACIMAKEVAE